MSEPQKKNIPVGVHVTSFYPTKYGKQGDPSTYTELKGDCGSVTKNGDRWDAKDPSGTLVGQFGRCDEAERALLDNELRK